MLRVLNPWFENLKKRQVKSPRVYLRDSGLLHSLMGLTDFAEINGHPKCGASFEGFAVEQIISAFEPRDRPFRRGGRLQSPVEKPLRQDDHRFGIGFRPEFHALPFKTGT